MTIQLNPPVVDTYDTKTLAAMRRYVFDSLGFIYTVVNGPGGSNFETPFSASNFRPLGPFVGEIAGATVTGTAPSLVGEIATRLGIAVGNTPVPYTLGDIRTSLFNMLGMAAMAAFPPPGVIAMLNSFIDEATQALYRSVELDTGTNPPPFRFTATDTSQDGKYTTNTGLNTGSPATVIDGQAVLSYATGLGKMHYGQEDGGIYLEQMKKYLADLGRRGPPNILNMIVYSVQDAQRQVLRRYEMGITNVSAANALGSAGTFTNYPLTPFSAPGDLTSVDSQPVLLLALANMKTIIGQQDAKIFFEQYEQYMKDLEKRLPPNSIPLVNRLLKQAQDMLYRQYRVFRTERWFNWTLFAGQRFYGRANDNDAVLPTPTGVSAVLGQTNANAGITGTIPNAVAYSSATLLNNGQVLIAGGLGSGALYRSAYLYNPQTGLVTATGSMNIGRYGHIATLLNDGRVLVIGGKNSASAGQFFTTTAEIYDPTTGVFTLQAGSMMGVRDTSFGGYAVCVLANGKVLISGGSNPSTGNAIVSQELFDPATGTFTATTPLGTARVLHTASLLPDNTVLLAGGAASGGGTVYATTEIYNPATGGMSAGGAMGTERKVHTATALPDGTVLITGGTSNSADLRSTEVYNPSITGGAFVAGPNMSVVRGIGSTATLLNGGRVLIAGGLDSANTAEAYNIASKTFSAQVSMLYSLNYATYAAASSNDGNAILVAGQVGSNYINNIQVYNAATNTFIVPGGLTAGTDYYRVAAFDSQGHYTLPSVEIHISTVPAGTSVVLVWQGIANGGVAGYAIYGRAQNAEQLLATVPANFTSWIDYGTILPSGAMPTINNTGTFDLEHTHPIIDQRCITWVGISRGDVDWRPLSKGIRPEYYTNQNNGIPMFYDIRQAIELWPPPQDSSWILHIKGHFPPLPFEGDTDINTLDWQAIYLKARADAKVIYKQPDAKLAQEELEQYIGELVAGAHTTERYTPGLLLKPNAVRPLLLDQQGNPI